MKNQIKQHDRPSFISQKRLSNSSENWKTLWRKFRSEHGWFWNCGIPQQLETTVRKKAMSHSSLIHNTMTIKNRLIDMILRRKTNLSNFILLLNDIKYHITYQRHLSQHYKELQHKSSKMRCCTQQSQIYHLDAMKLQPHKSQHTLSFTQLLKRINLVLLQAHT